MTDVTVAFVLALSKTVFDLDFFKSNISVTNQAKAKASANHFQYGLFAADSGNADCFRLSIKPSPSCTGFVLVGLGVVIILLALALPIAVKTC